MRNDEENRPKKRGRLKWTCGGCLIAILLLCIVAALSWRYLTRREIGISAWEHLPPSTAMAIEARDAYSILEHLLRDKGVVSLASRFAGINGEHAAFGGGAGSDFGEAFEAYERLRFLLPAVMPGSAILGITQAGDFFLIARPPNWYKLITGKSEGIDRKSIGGATVFVSHIDGWAVAAAQRDLVGEILDRWKDRSAPLGQARTKREAFVVMAGRTVDGTGEAAAAAPPEPQFLGLGDPFAGNSPASVAEDAAWKVLLLPRDGGWRAEGSAARVAAAGMKAFFDAAAMKIDPSEIPELPPIGISDALARAVISPRLLDKWLPPPTTGNPANGPAAKARAFLRKEWVDKATGDYLLRAKKPAVALNPDLPPLPVFTLGWRLSEGADGAAAAGNFAASLRELVDSLANEGPKVARMLWRNVDVVALNRTDGTGEIWEVPPVVLNSARPSWFFPSGGASAGGWLATDPAGLPEKPDIGVPIAPGAAGSFTGAARWDLSEDFLLSLVYLCRDRLETVPDTAVADKEALLSGITLICDILAAYPKGSVNCHGNADAATISFAATIPFGVEAGSVSPP